MIKDVAASAKNRKPLFRQEHYVEFTRKRSLDLQSCASMDKNVWKEASYDLLRGG